MSHCYKISKMLDSAILQQVTALFYSLTNDFQLKAKISSIRSEAEEMRSFLTEFAGTSPRVTCEFVDAEDDALEFEILRNGDRLGITFRGIPGGHEFTSLLLAILNADGKGKNLPDDVTARRVKRLLPSKIKTFVSLSCTNCPDIVQSLNIMCLLNNGIEHEMIDGALFQDEAEAYKVQAVPTVFADGKLLHVGRGSLGELLDKLEKMVGCNDSEEGCLMPPKQYDVIVIGGGPAGSSAAIYSARKGLKVAVVAQRVGGQVKETVGIENLVSVTHTTGAKLAEDLKMHMSEYAIEVYENRTLEQVSLDGSEKLVQVRGGETFIAPAVIIATGAGWRRLGVEGETEYIGRGVAFCPHCDGPLYKGKDVVVVGGGNSGVEAAIDLAGICNKVYVLEFAETLKADNVLIDKANKIENIEIFTSLMTTRVLGDGNKVQAIMVKDRITGKERQLPIDGVFVQIGLSPNSQIFEGLGKTQSGEIIIDSACRTSLKGVYAAGDVTNVPYKQIVIAMGEGAKAALSAFDDRIREL